MPKKITQAVSFVKFSYIFRSNEYTVFHIQCDIEYNLINNYYNVSVLIFVVLYAFVYVLL